MEVERILLLVGLKGRDRLPGALEPADFVVQKLILATMVIEVGRRIGRQDVLEAHLLDVSRWIVEKEP